MSASRRSARVSRKPRPLNADEERAWRAFMRIMVVLPRAMDDDLEQRAGIGLTRYTVLMHLSEATGRQLCMSDLAARTAVSPSRMTRIIAAMELDGLVTRSSTPDNHRISLVNLTEAGLVRLSQAWPAHLAGARSLLMDHLAPDELPAVTDVLTRLLKAVEDLGQ